MRVTNSPATCVDKGLDLKTLISKVDKFLTLQNPETIEAFMEMSDQGYFLERELTKHFRFFLDAPLEFDQKTSIFEKGMFLSSEAKEELTFFEKEKLIDLVDRLRVRCNELYEKSLPWKHAPAIKPYSDRELFKREWKKPLVAMKRFLSDDRVRGILKGFQTLEDKVFVIYILEPSIYSYVEAKENSVVENTLSKSTRIPNTKPSKPGPQDPEGVNKLIVLLAIHFKKCLGKEHYSCIADLLSLSQGRNRTEHSIKMKLQRLKDSKGWNQKWWEDYYHYQYDLCKMIAKDSGLSQLVR